MVLPDDAVEIKKVVSLVPVEDGALIPSYELCRMFLAHTMKTPQYVRQFYDIIVQSNPCTAVELVDAYVDVIKFSHGRRFNKVYKRMNSGLGHATTGLAIHSQAKSGLGLLRKLKGGKAICPYLQIVKYGP